MIDLKALELMVDTSLRQADKVVVDDQSVKGELWLMRNARWIYVPLEFQILYHVQKGVPFVVLFKYTNHPHGWLSTKWRTVPDTETYRKLLKKADSERSKGNVPIPLVR
jgi:hypothetical protein